MAESKQEEIKRRDKREAAIHEAGHLTVGLALGVRGSAWVYRSETTDPDNEKLWIGKHEAHGLVTATVAVSGLVAECWVEKPETSPDEIADWIDDGLVSPSPTDKTRFPESYEETLTAIVEAHAILVKHKRFFEWAVDELIKFETITDGMAAEKWRELYA
ncbi:MAG TPA: hypothetical protein VFB80_19520 [Pirellulaceae bacterium]|nr:hypothetical protein [Pirellulaceae bacterium]